MYRLLQKRWKIIDSEDFMSVRDTYPEFPRQDQATLDPDSRGNNLKNNKNSKIF